MPNDLGAYLALSLPYLIGYLLASWRQKHPRWITACLAAVVALMSANLVLTLTRAAWVSVTIAIAALAVTLSVTQLQKIETAYRIWRRVLLGRR